MRAVFFLVLPLLASGCFFPTPLLTPEPVPHEQTRVEVSMSGYGMMPLPFANAQVRHGIANGTEVNARAAWAVGTPAAAVGAGLTQRVTPAEAPIRASIHASVSAFGAMSEVDTEGGYAFHPSVLVGTDRLYGGARLSVGSWSGNDQVFAGPFVGARYGSKDFVGVELGLIRAAPGSIFDDSEASWLLAPAVTFGLRPSRDQGGIPAPEQLAQAPAE
ncbi:MAG: hypothetical protein AAGI52_17665 [Bacteroidota bacterium]